MVTFPSCSLNIHILYDWHVETNTHLFYIHFSVRLFKAGLARGGIQLLDEWHGGGLVADEGAGKATTHHLGLLAVQFS